MEPATTEASANVKNPINERASQANRTAQSPLSNASQVDATPESNSVPESTKVFESYPVPEATLGPQASAIPQASAMPAAKVAPVMQATTNADANNTRKWNSAEFVEKIKNTDMQKVKIAVRWINVLFASLYFGMGMVAMFSPSSINHFFVGVYIA